MIDNAGARRVVAGVGCLAGEGVRMVAAAVVPATTVALRPATWLVSRAIDVAVPGAVEAVLRRVDLTELVREHVDIDALARGVNIDGILDRVDLVTRAETLIAEVDLPAIIRSSSGAVTSDAVHGFRLQGISGDEAVRRAVARWGHRRRIGETPPEVSR